MLTTPTLGNICQECDERIHIFHRLDDIDHDSFSDIEIDVINNTNKLPLPSQQNYSSSKDDFHQRQQRPETPVIVDDNDMLYDIFMKKIDQQRQFRSQLLTDATTTDQQTQQFVSQFHSTYTPPQSSAGSSEGDESKVIEILTSRESTPAAAIPILPPQKQSGLVDQHGHRIVAIIELDDGEENECKTNETGDKNCGVLIPLTNCSKDLPFIQNHNQNQKSENCHPSLEDDEEIVFRKVDSEKDNSSVPKKRKRKSYDDKQLRLVASLSLVSSDSETEECNVRQENEKSLIDRTTTKVVSNFISCGFCKLKFPDSESLSVHERIHQGVKCILCEVGFTQIKRLIHHMRCKHREYNGDVLSEKPRTGQDSCMTIRLRYMQRTTFYECQLCGRIDEIFKDHKDHIIDKHANESKSLKDPMMKQLKCPVCKAKCGAQYLSLCRHLITSHEYQDYKNHLRELVHVSAFGWNVVRQQEVAKTAKIFQFIKRKTFFFECKICHKVVAGYLHHLRHVNRHQANGKPIITKQFLQNDLKETVMNAKRTAKQPIHTSDTINKSNVKSKSKQKSKELLKIEEDSAKNYKKILKTKKTEKLKTNPIKRKPGEIETKLVESKTKIQIRIKPKPKDTLKSNQSVVKLTKVRPKKESGSSKNKDNDKRKPKGKGKDNVQKPQFVKVKVKPPIRQIDLQKFKCNYCSKKFKGFRVFNLHLLQQHKDNEYCRCLKCNKAFKNASTLEEHNKQCQHIFPLSKRKSKISTTSFMLEKYSETFKEVPRTYNITCNTEYNNYQWLQDLLNINTSSKASDSNSTALCSNNNYNRTLITNFQCCYCLHLFADKNSLNKHTKQQHSQKEDIFIKYKPFKIINT